MTSRKWSCRRDQSAVRVAGKGRARRPDGGRIVLAWDGGELTNAGSDGGIAQHRRARGARRGFLEQFEPFRADSVFEGGKPGGIASRPRQTIDQVSADRVD